MAIAGAHGNSLHSYNSSSWRMNIFSSGKNFHRESIFTHRGNEGVVTCPNALITTILIKIQYEKEDLIKKGLDWILKYQ